MPCTVVYTAKKESTSEIGDGERKALRKIMNIIIVRIVDVFLYRGEG